MSRGAEIVTTSVRRQIGSADSIEGNLSSLALLPGTSRSHSIVQCHVALRDVTRNIFSFLVALEVRNQEGGEGKRSITARTIYKVSGFIFLLFSGFKTV